MHRVFFSRENLSVSVPEGTTVLEAERQAKLSPDAPCGGAGRCGKCLVRIAGQRVKACQYTVTEDVTVDTSGGETAHEILTEGFSGTVAFLPGLQMHRIRLEKPSPGEKRSDWERMLEELSLAGGPASSRIKPDPELAATLYDRRREAPQWYVIHTDEEILELCREEKKLYFAAFDIGTTTVAGYLLDARTGVTAAVESRLNPQTQYGADVIMRANYALEHGAQELSACIRGTLDEMLGAMADRAGADVRDIYQVSVVGNTCMHHLFLGIVPASLVHAPYTPAVSCLLTLSASDYGLRIHPKGRLLMLPNIAGYIGADTCGCLMAVRPDLRDEITLLLDIGTNGELVLGNKDRLAACSTAAGPAFEGAKIECGMRGAAGAIDHVFCENGVWRYTTVGGHPAKGLCGSGLIDLTALLLREGLVGEGGRLDSGQEDPHVFVLAPPEASGCEKGVYLTQKDVREIQLAKAAIAAGIRILMKTLEITQKDISAVYIAGAFGNYMVPSSAGILGMIPEELAGRVIPVGNAAGEGAKIALLNQEELKRSEELAGRIEYVELAASPDFQDCFVEELGFSSAVRDSFFGAAG